VEGIVEILDLKVFSCSRETTDENKQLLKTKTWKSKSYMISKSFEGYCCFSNINVFAWWATKNNAYTSLWPVMLRQNLKTVKI